MTVRVGRLLAMLIALAVVAVGGWLFRDGSGRQADSVAGAQALAAARDGIPAIMSYQPDTAQRDLPAAAKDRLTGTFLDEYTQLIATVVVPEATQKGISASATIPAAAVVSADADHAVVLAFVDQTVKTGAAPATQTATSVRVSMDKVEGRWLISGFEPI